MSGKRHHGKITVFLSYSTIDQSIAKIISNLFGAYPDIRIFDVFELKSTENIWERIRTEINQCSLLLTIITPNSVDNPNISWEIGAAWVAYKMIVPIVTDPELLREYVIRDFQHILLDDIGKPEVIQHIVELAREAKAMETAAKTKIRKSA